MSARHRLSSLCFVLGVAIQGWVLIAPHPAAAREGVFLSARPAERAQAVSAIGINVPPVVNAAEGDSISITATAGSGDPHSIITLTLTGYPPGLTFTTNTPTSIGPRATVSGLLGFETAGTWELQWYAQDQFGATDSKTTQLVVSNTPTDVILEARAFTSGGNGAVRLWGGKPAWCVQVEPVDGDFELTQVDLTSITISDAREGGNTVPATAGKSWGGGDRDRNGIAELTACVSRENLDLLFAVDDGSESVPLLLEGRLLDGVTFRADFSVRVLRSRGGHVRASVVPNPLNPRAVLSVFVPGAGFLRVRLFDTSGRLVRTLVDEDWVAAGRRTVSFDARDALGRALGSGVYLYRVETRSGSATGRMAIVK